MDLIVAQMDLHQHQWWLQLRITTTAAAVLLFVLRSQFSVVMAVHIRYIGLQSGGQPNQPVIVDMTTIAMHNHNQVVIVVDGRIVHCSLFALMPFGLFGCTNTIPVAIAIVSITGTAVAVTVTVAITVVFVVVCSSSSSGGGGRHDLLVKSHTFLVMHGTAVGGLTSTVVVGVQLEISRWGCRS